MDDFNANLDEVYRYQRERLPVSAIHPELRFTRLGAVLREHATEPSDVGELAYQALTSPHDQPLELMPLHLLRDKMQEEPEHPLAKQFVWTKLPERLVLDRTVASHWDGWPDKAREVSSIVYDPDSEFHGRNKNVDDALRSINIAKLHTPGLEDVGRREIRDAAHRWLDKRSLSVGQNDPDAENNHTDAAEQSHPAHTYR